MPDSKDYTGLPRSINIKGPGQEIFTSLGAEWEARVLQAQLDDLGAPRSEGECLLSLWGRVQWLISQRTQAAPAPQGVSATINPLGVERQNRPAHHRSRGKSVTGAHPYPLQEPCMDIPQLLAEALAELRSVNEHLRALIDA